MKKKKFISEMPELMKEWDWEANADLDPTKITAGSHKRARWKCSKCGHKWSAVVSSRGCAHRGCPGCSNRALVKGFNDFATKFPKIAKEWHPTKNGKLKPTDIIASTHKTAWWVCSKGQEYVQALVQRTIAKARCPYCMGQKILIGFNDLVTTNSRLASEWHPFKNGSLKPTDVMAGSRKKVWWKCSKCGHEWKAVVVSRGLWHRGCPRCSEIQKGRTIVSLRVKQRGSLAEKIPELIQEWHQNKNGNLTPYDITAGSHTRFWWKCSKCGYEWQTAVKERGLRHHGCPCCAGQKVLAGFNDLETVNPRLASEWHPTKNGSLKPTDVTAGSKKKIWWKCSKCGHEWQAEVVSRGAGHRGCPKCAKKKKSASQFEFDFGSKN